MKSALNEKFRKSLEEGYKKYLSIHPRSSKKIVPMHQCISEIFLKKLGGKKNNFTIKSMGIGDGKEYNLEGKYYSKDVDITVFYKNKPISGIGFKFITSNYKQNSNNYFENMLGETTNLRRNEFLYGQMLVFKYKMPYYSSDKKTFTKIEHINSQNIKKYLKLNNDKAENLYHKPDIMHISFIETGDEKEFFKIVKKYKKSNIEEIDKLKFHKKLLPKVKVKFLKPKDLETNDFDKSTLEYLEKVSNFENFIKAFINLTKGKTYGR
jgi:hypothetical protein